MAKVKNRRDNHDTKRGRYYAARGMEMPGKENSSRREGGRDGRGAAAGRAADRSARSERSARPAARRESFDPLRRFMVKNGIVRINIDPLTVFADPFDTPELYLGRDSNCIVFPEVKKWSENRMLRAKNIKDKLDFEAAVAALDKALVITETK